MPDRSRIVTLVAGAAPTISALRPMPAQAHVKWFCAFDVAGSPVGLENVLCPDFEQLVVFAIGVLLFGCIVEGSPFGVALLRSLDRATRLLHRNVEIVVRIVVAGFFASLWTRMHVLLTPELTTNLAFVPWLQLAIAAAMLSRRTLPLAALGIVGLFVMAVLQYGAFHLMDYPVFLGLAGYLACIGLRRAPFGLRPLDLLRWSAAITLMWASVEKWAYPQWTFPIFVAHPGMSFGIEIAYYMRAAGVVEFTLAFALLGTPLVRRCAAIILATMFTAAIGEFGMIDAIGHSCIIAVMLATLADNARAPSRRRRRTVCLMPVGYLVTLTVFLIGYYGLHSTLFGTTVG